MELLNWVFGSVVTVVLASTVVIIIRKGFQIMSNRPAKPRQARPPQNITKLNDYVWQLKPPTGESKVDIIFFHGLQLDDFEDAFWKTWRAQGSEELVWPREWMGENFKTARILSISYNSCAMKSQGQTDMDILGENLVTDIVLDSEYNIGQNCPVFLVGHSLGGLVIKQLIISTFVQKSECNEERDRVKLKRIEKFHQNLKGVFYYATPHQGSKIADLTGLLVSNNPILELLKTLNTKRARINEHFRKYRENLDVKAYAVAENLPMQYGPFNGIVVEEASARFDIGSFYTIQTADHISVCKAASEADGVVRLLKQFIIENMPSGPDLDRTP